MNHHSLATRLEQPLRFETADDPADGVQRRAGHLRHVVARKRQIDEDAGFDPLLHYLKSRKIGAVRSRSIDEIPLLKAANSKSMPEKISVVVANLKQRGASKPRTVKTLSSTISSLFQKQLPGEELTLLLAELQARGYITVAENKVSYSLPGIDSDSSLLH